MKFDFKKTTSFFKEKFVREPVGKDDLIFLERDWLRLLSMFALLGTIIVIFGGYIFYKVSYGDFFGGKVSEIGAVETLSRARLDLVIDTYEERRAEFERLKRSRREVPSL